MSHKFITACREARTSIPITLPHADGNCQSQPSPIKLICWGRALWQEKHLLVVLTLSCGLISSVGCWPYGSFGLVKHHLSPEGNCLWQLAVGATSNVGRFVACWSCRSSWRGLKILLIAWVKCSSWGFLDLCCQHRNGLSRRQKILPGRRALLFSSLFCWCHSRTDNNISPDTDRRRETSAWPYCVFSSLPCIKGRGREEKRKQVRFFPFFPSPSPSVIYYQYILYRTSLLLPCSHRFKFVSRSPAPCVTITREALFCPLPGTVRLCVVSSSLRRWISCEQERMAGRGGCLTCTKIQPTTRKRLQLTASALTLWESVFERQVLLFLTPSWRLGSWRVETDSLGPHRRTNFFEFRTSRSGFPIASISNGLERTLKQLSEWDEVRELLDLKEASTQPYTVRQFPTPALSRLGWTNQTKHLRVIDDIWSSTLLLCFTRMTTDIAKLMFGFLLGYHHPNKCLSLKRRVTGKEKSTASRTSGHVTETRRVSQRNSRGQERTKPALGVASKKPPQRLLYSTLHQTWNFRKKVTGFLLNEAASAERLREKQFKQRSTVTCTRPVCCLGNRMAAFHDRRRLWKISQELRSVVHFNSHRILVKPRARRGESDHRHTLGSGVG